MLGDPLVYSFSIDTTSASMGLPWCAQGRQPRFVKPRFIPDQIKHFLGLAEIEEILHRLNKIFHVGRIHLLLHKEIILTSLAVKWSEILFYG